MEAGPTADEQRYMAIAQTRLFDRLVRVLDRASSDAPLVLELEDIHWADPSTRAFLPYLVANARSARLLIVATFRSEEGGRAHPLASVLRQLGRLQGAARIDLLPFDADELREQLHGILGEAPSNRLLGAIHARSEGNALFAEELIASGDPDADLPPSIAAALLSRTAGLSQAAQVAVRAASVAGRTASYEVLRSATALPDDELGAALREAVGENILEPDHVAERYRFRHALLQEAIYQDTLPGERRRLHARVAESLQGDDEGPQADPQLASQIAHHWFEAKDHKRALAASLAAGDAAVRQAAYLEALHHYERVIDLWEKVPLANADIRQADILERTSRSAALVGDPQKTITYARKALDVLDATDDAIVRVRVLDELVRAVHSVTDDAIEYELRLGAIELNGLPVREQMIVLDSRARALRWNGDPAAAGVAAMQALRIADSSDDPELRGDAHLIMAWNLFDRRDLDGALREALLARELASVAGDPETEVEAQRVVYVAYSHTGKYEKAMRTARAARAYAHQVGLFQWEGPWASYFEAAALFEMGRISESNRVIEAALLDPPAGWAFRNLQVLAARVSIVCGSFEDAAKHLEAARIPNATLEAENSHGYLAVARAELARWEGRLQDLRAIVVATAAAIVGLPNFTEKSEKVWHLVEIGLDGEAANAETARAAGDERAIQAASTAAKMLLGYVRKVQRQRDSDGVPNAGKNSGDEALIMGHLARIEGRDDPALWVAAAESFPPRSPRALLARYRQAEAMLAARVPPEEIRAVMVPAHAAAVDIGARPLAGRLEGLARRARIDLRRPASGISTVEAVLPVHEDAPAPGTVALRGRGLSDREIEVLTLVAAGFSNGDIGKRLFITRKTAAVHVTHILDKLDVASRTEAATIGVRLGLPEVERDDAPL